MVSVGQHWCQCHVNGEGTGKTGQQTVLYNFTNGTDGANPVGSAQGLSEPAKKPPGQMAPHLLPGDSHVAGGASGGGDVAFEAVIHDHAIGVEAPA